MLGCGNVCVGPERWVLLGLGGELFLSQSGP